MSDEWLRAFGWLWAPRTRARGAGDDPTDSAVSTRRPELPAGCFRPGQRLSSDLTGSRWTVLDCRVGGMGVVYRVRDHADGVTRGVKALHPDLVGRVEARERFLKEATLWARLEPHPNVVAAEWIDIVGDQPVVVMEWAEGGDLAKRIADRSLRRNLALELAIELCDGVDFAHRRGGIVHRDLKPANCLLTRAGHLKVGDFGIATALLSINDSPLRQGGARSVRTGPAGTEGYMAPEQRGASFIPDVRADVYAFGVMLFEMVTFRLPPFDTLGRYLTVNVQAMVAEATRERLPRSLANLIADAVAPDVDARPSGFDVLRGELAAILSREYRVKAPLRTEAEPGSVVFWNNKAVGFHALGLHEEAVASYDRALEQLPGDPELWQNRGASLLGLDRFSEALECFERALASTPSDRDILNNKGLALLKLGAFDAAITCLTTAAESGPLDPLLCRNLGEALCQAGRIEEGLVWCRRGLSVDGRSSSLLELEGFALLALGEFEAAEESFASGLAIAPRRPGLWKGSGLVRARRGEDEAAVAAFDRCLAFGGDTSVREHRAAASDRLGKKNSAGQ